jgi:hypothetical protein
VLWLTGPAEKLPYRRIPHRALCVADQIAESVFRRETFPFHTRYRLDGKQQRVKIMSQRLRVQEVVMQMHEKNTVLVNILRDIIENEPDYDLSIQDEQDDEFWRKLNDRAVRRAEILAEIQHFLLCEKLSQRVNA